MTVTIPPAPSVPTPKTLTYVDSSDFSTYAQGWTDRDAALTARIKELEAGPTPPPPTGDVIHWGINASSAAQFSAQLPLYGPGPLSWRYYHQPGEKSAYPTEYKLRPGDIFVVSDKVLPHQKNVADLVAMFRAAPTDRPFIYCPWHEPEDDVSDATKPGKNPHFTMAQLRQGFALSRQAWRQAGSPAHVFIAVILMGYSWTKGSGRNVEDYIPADSDFDLITTDTYFDGPIGTPVATIPGAWDAQIATAAKHGKTWGVTETGVGHKVSGQQRIDAVTLLGRTIKAKLLGQPVKKAPLLAQWFDVPNGSGDPSAWDLNATEAAAWRSVQ